MGCAFGRFCVNMKDMKRKKKEKARESRVAAGFSPLLRTPSEVPSRHVTFTHQTNGSLTTSVQNVPGNQIQYTTSGNNSFPQRKVMILTDKKRGLSAHGRQRSVRGFLNERRDWTPKNFLTVAPALPLVSGVRTQTPRLGQRSASITGRGLETSDLEMAPHDVVYLQQTSEGKLQASRSQKDKEKNPDRICLDRRGLTHLPNFVGEKNIRLLSLQHNLINRLEGVQNLGKLVFLDLYNNQLEKISGLDLLENLRVLLIGKNRLKKMEGLKSLTKLEVLDLHGNQICQISGITGLGELKVLNLAGNHIRSVDAQDLEGLTSLQELNLKRNRLRKVSDLSGPAQLEKLFLSNNEILSIDDMMGICGANSLKEVTIDSNPVALGNDCVHLLVSSLPRLQVLSHMQVTDQVRKTAMQWKRNRENVVRNAENMAEVTRGEVISNARSNWELLRKQTKCFPLMTSSLKDLRVIEDYESNFDKTIQSDSVLSVASSITLSSRESVKTRRNFQVKRSLSEDAADESSESEFFKLPPILASLTEEKTKDSSSTKKPVEQTPEETSGTSETEEDSGNAENTRKRSKSANLSGKVGTKKERNLTGKIKPKPPAPGKVREQGGDYLIEICGRCLNVYGQGALRFIDRPWNPSKAGDVTTVRFNYVSFGGICNVLGKLKQRFPNAENFIFRETNITSLGQLNALADVQGLSSLQIDEEGNSITEKNWRSYAIYRLAHWGLKTINGEEVREGDLAAAAEEYQGLSDLVLWSLPESLLQPLLTRLRIEGGRSNSHQTARQWLWNADPALRSVVIKEALQWRRGTQDDMYWRHKGKNHLSYIIDLTCAAIEKLQVFESRWPSMLNQLIRDTLVDYSQFDSYMKKCLQELS